MYSEEINVFIELVKSEINGTKLPENIGKKITSEMLVKLYRVSVKHDLLHVVAMALQNHNLLGVDDVSKVFIRGIHTAMFRYETMQYELEQIYKVLEKEQIAYVPLKGAVIRSYYPEPWMRTSSDIDILVKKEELERAKQALVQELGYVVVNNNFHDVALASPGKNLLELHFQILENIDSIDRMLSRVWEFVSPIEEGKYKYAMTSEYFVFHAMAHMLYHFQKGGCGVRFLVDIWILENKMQYDKKILHRFYKECGIERFAQYAEKLARVWFGEEKHDKITEKMQEYIIEGGLFGTTETRVRARKTKTKGKVGYIVRRVFVPYDDLKEMHAKLKKYPMLYPFYLVKRWFKLFDKNVAGKAASEVIMNTQMNQESIDDLKGLFKNLKI